MNAEVFGWLFCIVFVLYLMYKFWKRIIKTILLVVCVFFILGVFQVKKVYDKVFDTPEKKEAFSQVVIDSLDNNIDKILK